MKRRLERKGYVRDGAAPIVIHSIELPSTHEVKQIEPEIIWRATVQKPESPTPCDEQHLREQSTKVLGFTPSAAQLANSEICAHITASLNNAQKQKQIPYFDGQVDDKFFQAFDRVFEKFDDVIEGVFSIVTPRK
jgi:hypothetical protein